MSHLSVHSVKTHARTERRKSKEGGKGMQKKMGLSIKVGGRREQLKIRKKIYRYRDILLGRSENKCLKVSACTRRTD